MYIMYILYNKPSALKRNNDCVEVSFISTYFTMIIEAVEGSISRKQKMFIRHGRKRKRKREMTKRSEGARG